MSSSKEDFISMTKIDTVQKRVINPSNLPEVPLYFGLKSNERTQQHIQKVISGEIFVFMTLKEIIDAHFPFALLKHLSSMRHQCCPANNKSVSLKTASFYVCIGTSNAFDRHGFTHSKIRPWNSINLPDLSSETNNYQTLMTNFMWSVFPNDKKYLDDYYKRNETFSICIFARSARNDNDIITYTDNLIAAITLPSDNYNSILISYIGIPLIPIKDLNIHPSLNKGTKTFQKDYKLGTFLIAISQIIKSMGSMDWLPVICQVSTQVAMPTTFYRKTYFIKLSNEHPFVQDQYTNRKSNIIFDDELLVWRGLFFPLIGLIMFETMNKNDPESLKLIFSRGQHCFLSQPLNPDKYHGIFTKMKQICNNNDNFLKESNIIETKYINVPGDAKEPPPPKKAVKKKEEKK